MCFRCLMFSLSGPCELLFLLLFYYLLDLSWCECDVISLYFCVALLMDLFVLCVACLTVLVNYLVKQFTMCLSVVVIFCWMLWKYLVWLEVLCWIDRVWSSKECAFDPSVHLGVSSIGLVHVFVCQKLSPHLRVWELDHRCLLPLCCSFVWLWVRACSCYASYPLVCCAL